MPPTGESASHSRTWLLVGGGIAALAIFVVLLIALVSKSGSSGGSASNASTTTAAPTTTVAPSTTTTLDPISAARAAKPQLYDLASRLENVLQQSSQGRGQVASLVGNVRSCLVTPNTAAVEIDQIVANRRTVLGQIASLTNNAGAEGTALITLLQAGIQYSIDADIGYATWMRYLYANYYYTYPIGCPSGSAPTNSSYSDAVAASGRASTAKQQFTDQFNAIADSFGLTTWDPGTI